MSNTAPLNDAFFTGIENTTPQTETHAGEAPEAANTQIKGNLLTVLKTREKLRELKSRPINFSDPVLRQGENAVIFPHTINVIQGQAGVHKSRLAETICSAFLTPQLNANELLGFNRVDPVTRHTVVYVDTERNLSEQLPYALQSIQKKAGYRMEEHPQNFEYISLLEIARKDRFGALREYLDHLRKSITNPLFIVLDVSTDCIEDFNKTDKSMELIDLMNVAINQHDVVFLCLIHENPKSDKARGHFGTELMNKASTVMQVSFEKDGDQNDTDLIRVKYLKCRSTARHTPFYVKYSNEVKGLVLADPGDVSQVMNNRKHKASNEDVIEHLEMYLGDRSELSRRDLLDKLNTDFRAKDRTMEVRLKQIIESEECIRDNNGNECKLVKDKRDKKVFYKLAEGGPF
jgi:hypothetical protein